MAEAPNSRSKLFSPEDLCARSNFPGRKSGDGPRMAGPRVDRKKCDIKLKKFKTLNRLSRRKKGMTFFCIFPMNFAMATLGLKEMGKFLWEGRGKSLPSLLSQFSFAKLRQPTGQTFFPTFPNKFFHFLQT